MRRRWRIALSSAAIAGLTLGGIMIFLCAKGRGRPPAAEPTPYGLTSPIEVELRVPSPAHFVKRVSKGDGSGQPQRPALPAKGTVEAVSIRRYDPPYDVVNPLWRNPADRKSGSPEEAHFSALSSTTREELLKCFTEQAQKRLLAADARQGGKLLLSGSEEMPWPPDPFTRYLYRVDLRRGGERYALIKVRPVFVKDPPPQDDPNGIYEFVMTFVETPRGWLRTFELDLDPLLQLVQATSYDQLLAQAGAVRAKPSSR